MYRAEERKSGLKIKKNEGVEMINLTYRLWEGEVLQLPAHASDWLFKWNPPTKILICD